MEVRRVDPWLWYPKASVVIGERHRTTLTNVLKTAIEYGIVPFVLDVLGEMGHIIKFSDGLILMPIGKVDFNPLKPFGDETFFFNALAEILAYASQPRSTHYLRVYKVLEFLRSYKGDEPTASALISDIEISELPTEPDLLELLTPLQDYSLCFKERISMDKVMERGACIDLSNISSTYVRSVVSLVFMLRVLVLSRGRSLIVVTHPHLIWGTEQDRLKVASAAEGFLPEAFMMRGVGLLISCESPEEVPNFIWKKARSAFIEHDVGKKGLPMWLSRYLEYQPKENSVFFLTRDGNVRRMRIEEDYDFATISNAEVTQRLREVVSGSASTAFPRPLVEQFGDKAKLAVELLRRIKDSNPSFEDLSEWTKKEYGQVSLEVLGGLARLQFIKVVQTPNGARVELTRKGQGTLSDLLRRGETE
ncbi:MAG: hypothetical protein QXF26_00725 [Candidatus Bathyarchaeia archaeon]